MSGKPGYDCGPCAWWLYTTRSKSGAFSGHPVWLQIPTCSAAARQAQRSQVQAAVVLHAPGEREVSSKAREPNSDAHR